MKKKRVCLGIVCIALSAVMCVSLAGCKKKSSSGEEGIAVEAADEKASKDETFKEVSSFKAEFSPDKVFAAEDKILLFNQISGGAGDVDYSAYQGAPADDADDVAEPETADDVDNDAGDVAEPETADDADNDADDAGDVAEPETADDVDNDADDADDDSEPDMGGDMGGGMPPAPSVSYHWIICDMDGNKQQDVTVTPDASGTSYRDVIRTKDGDIVILESGMSDNGDNNYTIITYSEDGTQKASVSAVVPGSESVSTCGLTDDGRLVVAAATDAILFDENGKQTAKIPYGVNYNVNNVIHSGNGDVILTCFDDSYNFHILKLDSANSKVTDAGQISNDMNTGITFDSTGQGYSRGGEGIYRLDFSDTGVNPVCIMNYLDSDLLGSDIMFYSVIDSENMVLDIQEDMNELPEICHYTKVAPEDVKDKKVIVVGTIGYVNNDVTKHILDYNKQSDEYRIRIADYDQFNDPDNNDFSGGERQLKNDLVDGLGPDIILTDSISNLDIYSNKGVFVDLYPLFEKNGLNKSDYFENVLKACETDGKLYLLAPRFNIYAGQMKKSMIGDRQNLTAEEMQQLEQQYNCVGKGISGFLQDDMIKGVLTFGGDTFYNMKTGECKFDSQEFRDYLAWIKQYPAEVPSDQTMDFYGSSEDKFHKNERIMEINYIGNFASFNAEEQVIFGEETVLTCFPGEGNGTGVIIPINGMAISSKSKNKDAAFDFVKYFISDDYLMPDLSEGSENEYYFAGFPLKLSAFDACSEMSMQKPYKMVDGQKVESDQQMYSNLQGKSIIVTPISADRVAYIKDYISGCNHLKEYDDTLMNIIEEESAYYFNDQKSAEEVTGIIQGRAENYIRENQ